MTIHRVSTADAVSQGGLVNRSDQQQLNQVSKIALAALPEQGPALRDLLGSMSSPLEIELLVLECLGSTSVAQSTNARTRQQFFTDVQISYKENHLLQTSGCVSESPDPAAFCIETAAKVRRMAAHLGIPKDKIADADSLDLAPTLKMMQPHIDHSLCVVFGIIVRQLTANSSAHQLRTIADEAERAKQIRSWMDDPQNEGAFNQVTQLDLSSLDLKLLPPEIEKCAHLTLLNLDTNQLLELPATIGNLGELIELHLSNNKLQSLPATIGNLGKLIDLYLHKNMLDKLPDALCNLGNLEMLDLSNNWLQELPATIGNLGNLQKLYLFANQLQKVPDTLINLRKLQTLTLADNGLRAFPAGIHHLTSLVWLNLSGNMLQSVPDKIDNLHNLVELNLGKNRLQSVPAKIGKLSKYASGMQEELVYRVPSSGLLAR